MLLEIIGLIFEFILLALAVYLYLFSRGIYLFKNESLLPKAEEFRANNGGWLRWFSLFLCAILCVNIYLHIQDLIRA